MKHRSTTLVAAALAVAVLTGTAALADAPISVVSQGDAALEWQPTVANAGTVLTISGPREITLRYEFAAGEAPFFQIFDASGYALPDGSYSWELQAIPVLDAASRAALEAARAAGDDSYHLVLQERGKLPGRSLVDNGHFTIQGGAIVSSNLVEIGADSSASGALRSDAVSAPAADGVPAGIARATGTDGNGLSTRDQIINDDLLVLRSLCVGFDCVNGEVFGSDTIRLKENNLRIKFMDTSVGAFPSADWQLTANSSLSGGANKFSIEDISAARIPFTVEANAPTNALYVDDGGRLGLGTSIPVVDLHVVSGNTPTLRLAQDASSGFAPQTWDVAGNETSFFIRDATNGSTLPFRIRPGAPSNSLYIDVDGNLAHGTASPDNDADVTVNSGENVALVMKKAGAVRFELNNTTAATEWQANNDGNGDFVISRVGSGGSDFEIEQSGEIGNCGNPDHDFVISTGPGCAATPRSWIDAGDAGFSTTSSRTVKQNLVPVAADGVLDKVRSIGVYEYDFINGPTDRIGLMAEDFHTIFGRGSEQEISSSEMQVALWLAVQELAAQNDALRSELEELKAER